MKARTCLTQCAIFLGFLLLLSLPSCGGTEKTGTGEAAPFVWENAHVYFLLTDRFFNGDPSNDLNYGRTDACAPMRGMEGGDLAGIIQKIEEGYFDRLGITAIWMTPFFEQNRGSTDEGTGLTYPYHGYWIQDWTRLDPNFGTEEELERLLETAHRHGIRIVMDVVINHTGPVTPEDPVWPEDWVRTAPPCTYQDYASTITCTLVENLPDIRTESDEEVALPPSLLEKWEKEGRLEQELAELDAFFERTGYPRAPRYYLIKWLTDYVRKYGIDAYRLDTAKHVEEGIWKELNTEAALAFEDWKKNNPDKVLDQNPFFTVGEVYNYGIDTERLFDFGDVKVDFYAQSIHSLINFAFKSDATLPYETLFSKYSRLLHGPLKGHSVMNYLASHDDGHPFDAERNRALEAGTRLLLTPGISQLYYGDESSRRLVVEGAMGDANLRSPMNWEAISRDDKVGGEHISRVMDHYGRLGQFRKEHPSVGAGKHRLLSQEPYLCTRSFQMGDYRDQVLIGLDLDRGAKRLSVGEVFEEGSLLTDYYSGKDVIVENGTIELDSPWAIVLLARK
jgi:alpha-amylase